MRSFYLNQFLSALLLFAAFMLAALAPEPVSGKSNQVSAESIKKVVQDSDILDQDYKQQVYALFEDGVASVSLFRHPDATRDDCKIDAVLLARKIMALDPDPNDIKLVRLVFYDYDRQNEYWEVEVRPQLVTAFAHGTIGEPELINSILLASDSQKNPLSQKFAALSYKGIVDFDAVCRGAYEDKRLAIHLRLEELQRQKIEMGRFLEDFLRIEDKARRGKSSELLPLITTLNKSLDSYVDEMIKAGQLQKPELRHSKNSIGIKN